ncbi:MAG: 3-hydroxyacyl-ACP dehydratase FabZ [Synergistales bacterium]|nr:3-hydroxyacyl-ACP dehydratase FabZ [Synergistales bacterium]
MVDIKGIMEHLPHRYPFLLVDRILEMEEGHVVGVKNVSINEPFFQGHFPGEPIMPGVLILESMAQVAGMMVVQLPGVADPLIYLTGVEHARFRRPVRPGDQLTTEAWVIKFRGRVGKVEAKATVDQQLVTQTKLSFALSERKHGGEE